MVNGVKATATVIPFQKTRKGREKQRKAGLNKNREGSVRNINGFAYVDFIYLAERVRENSGLDWNEKNARTVREQLDRINVAIRSNTFRFGDIFPNSKKKDYFSQKEAELFKLAKTPAQVFCREYFDTWYKLLKHSGRVAERTLFGYKSYLNLYLTPFFGDLPFASLNAATFDRFIFWARQKKYAGKVIENKTVNKCFTVLKMICKGAAIKYGWANDYNPFFGFKKLPENDAYEDISPFSPEEQERLIDCLPEHWRPYFLFAFSVGLRPGEQIALKPEDIDWENHVLHVRRALTLDENGKKTMGKTKNRYSRRTIKLVPVMMEALKMQQKIYEQFGGEYFFCSRTGTQIILSNLRSRVWVPTLKRAGLPYREMKQTRHTFATIALSCGESPLWIAKVMGHRNTEMIIKVYGKYIEQARGAKDGGLFNEAMRVTKSKDK
ncbi:MAG: tyrosine-type recombinase/integrase [Deltaproteobacteria bacterium]|nr:tyrosine-type recombinase/integrase [Deltaproteobacteria bacterium]